MQLSSQQQGDLPRHSHMFAIAPLRPRVWLQFGYSLRLLSLMLSSSGALSGVSS